jgi:hypothetical protein
MTVTGFRFADPDSKFADVIKKATYVYWRRELRRSVHNYAMSRFIADVLKPLNYSYEMIWQVVNHSHVRILKVTNDKNCILIVLRNRVNPLSNHEVEFLATALHRLARKLYRRDNFAYIWSFIMTQALEPGQTKLGRFGAINFCKLPYLVSSELLRRVKQKSGIDYSAAYPSQTCWSGDDLTALCATIKRHLTYIDPKTKRWLEAIRARTDKAKAAQQNASLNSNQTLPINSSSKHIVSIMTAPEKTTAGGTEGQPSDPPRAQKPSPLKVDVKDRKGRIGQLLRYALEGGHRSTDTNLPALLIKKARLAWKIQRRTAKDYVEIVIADLKEMENKTSLNDV